MSRGGEFRSELPTARPVPRLRRSRGYLDRPPSLPFRYAERGNFVPDSNGSAPPPTGPGDGCLPNLARLVNLTTR